MRNEIKQLIAKLEREILSTSRNNVPYNAGKRITNMMYLVKNDKNLSWEDKQTYVGDLVPRVSIGVLQELQKPIQKKLLDIPVELHEFESKGAKEAVDDLKTRLEASDVDGQDIEKSYKTLVMLEEALNSVSVDLESEVEEEIYLTALDGFIEVQDQIFDKYINFIQTIDKNYFPEQRGEGPSASSEEKSNEEDESLELDIELEEPEYVGNKKPG